MAEPIIDLPGEVWKPVPGWSGYRISNHGRVIGKFGRLRCLNKARGGYLTVALQENAMTGGRTRNQSVHRLVLEAFVRPPGKGEEANHVNCVRDDNRAVNLEWVTRQGNADHRMKYGKSSKGADNGNAKLNAKSAEAIRALLKLGWRQKEAAEAFNVSKQIISNIHLGLNW
jgi:hypothetical protein